MEKEANRQHLSTSLFYITKNLLPMVSPLLPRLKNVLFRLRPKRVLLAWELGSGFGHIGKLMVVADELERTLGSVTFSLALRAHRDDPRIAARFPGARIFPAPAYRPHDPSVRQTAYNYGDMLRLCGYHDPDVLTAMVDAWIGIYEDVNPDLIVCDHSPTVVFAAGERWPVVHIGTGFTVPPDNQPFHPINMSAAAGAVEREATVLANIQETCRRLGRPEILETHAVLRTASNIACCLPELDPCRQIRKFPAAGPLDLLPSPITIPDERRIFGYLSADDSDLPMILRSLATAGISGSVYLRGGAAPYQRFVENSRIELLDQPVDLARAVAGACAIIHHGGLTTSQFALGIGRPQFLLPRHWEQRLTSKAIEGLHCGLIVRGHKDVGAPIERATQRKQFEDMPTVVAQRLSRNSLCAKPRLVDASLARLGANNRL